MNGNHREGENHDLSDDDLLSITVSSDLLRKLQCVYLYVAKYRNSDGTKRPIISNS